MSHLRKLPDSDAVALELKRERYKRRYKKTILSTVIALIVAAAVAVLVAMLWLPVLQIYGSSMTPTLREGEVVVSVKASNMEQGDIVAFYYGNKLLVKRYIAGAGQWVDIKPDGTVLVDGVELDEPYVTDKAFGSCDLELPYQVPEGTCFLIGDHRETSIDSRHSSVGCVSQEQIVGKIVYRVWPFAAFGSVE